MFWGIGITATVIGVIILILVYVFALKDYSYSKGLDEDEYRNKVLKEEPDRYTYSDMPYYYNSMSDINKKKYSLYKKKQEKRNKRITNFLKILPCIIFIIIISSACYLLSFLEQEFLNVEIERYIASKETIETSLESNYLSGAERFELVKQAKEENEWLAQKQYEIKQWYRFYLDKDAVLGLEFIEL